MSAGKFAVMILGCVAALGAWAEGAGAQSCADDTGCPKGFSCEVTGMSNCGASTPAARPACDGGACSQQPLPELPVPACDPQEYRSCVPGNCMTDSDCATGMVCHERSTGTCAVAPSGPCSSDMKCPPPAPTICTETVEHICIPRYVLPCEQASDCGDGFTCEPQSVCGCSAGSSGTAGAGAAGNPVPSTPTPPPAMDAGAAEPQADRAFAPAPPPPDCTCKPTDEKYCKVIEVVCRADSDCPKTFTCKQSYVASTGPACVAPAKGDGGTCGAALPPTNVYRCVPPYENLDPGYGGKDEGGGGYPTMPTTTPENPTTTTPPPIGAPRPGTADAGVGTGTGQNPVPADGSGSEANGPSHVKACSVVSPGVEQSGAGGLWAALMSVAAAWVLARRRR
jgi:hypothetical protein